MPKTKCQASLGFVRGGGDAANPIAILGVKREHFEPALAEMQTNNDIIQRYFAKSLGIDTAGLAKLRDLYSE